jgi:hypothetical protein
VVDLGPFCKISPLEMNATSTPASPASGVSSWLAKAKAVVASNLVAASPVLSPAEAPSKRSDELAVAVSVENEPNGTPLEASNEKPWSKMKSMWKKATEIGADIIRLDPPDSQASAEADVVVGVQSPVSGDGKAYSTVENPSVEENSKDEADEETAGLLSGRIKLNLPALSTDRLKSVLSKGVSSVRAVIPAKLGGSPAESAPAEPEETFWGLSR